jgi:uncharacterized MAPEG superfamily protein
MPALNDYRITIVVMALAGLLLVLQLIVADLTAIRHRHKAGYPIPADSGQFLFRSARAHANTNESIAAFALLALAAVLSAASPGWTNALSALWLGSRVLHMGFYYANMKPLRSLAFALSLIALLGLFLTTASRWV